MKALYQWLRTGWQRMRQHRSSARAGVDDVRAAGTGVAAAQTGAAAAQTGAAPAQTIAAAAQTIAAAAQTGAAPTPPPAAAQDRTATAQTDREAPPTPAAAPPPLDEGGCLDALWRIFLPLRPVSLDEPARRRFSGLLFVGAISFVEAVADAVEHAPHLSPRVSAAELRARQGRAHFWFLLHRTLIYMTELAGDSYLHAQGSLIADAMDVVQGQRLAEEAAQLSGGDPGDLSAPLHAGRLALAGAGLILAQRNGRKRRQRQRARRERGQALLPRATAGPRPRLTGSRRAPDPAEAAPGPRRRLLARLVGEPLR